MSLKELAKQTGRNGDTELLHVSKDELKSLHGLAALHGTRLTTNPHTGLPEAFNLGGLFRTILPIAAGVAGSAVGMPWLGALASGALTTAQTGDLGKGIASGLGSYAMGNLGGQLLDTGAANLASQTAEQATQAGTQAASDAAAQGITGSTADLMSQAANTYGGTVPSSVLPGIAPGAAVSSGIGSGASGALTAPTMDTALQQSFPSLSADQIAQATSEGTPDLMAQRASMLNSFSPQNYQQPSMMDKLGALSLSDVGNVAKANPAGVIGAGMSVMDALAPQQKGPQQPNYGDLSNLSKAKVVPDYYTRNQRQFASGGLATLRPFACGGPVAFDQGGEVPGQPPGTQPPGMGNEMFPQANVASPMYSQATQAPMERSVLKSGYEQMTDPNTGDQVFAQGGLAMMAHGRAIRGPGDGMSDNVPATLGGVEPARLADGEYVLPADVVSHLGNGSTEAGTRKLDGMMSRIRKARTGNSKQGKQINADKYLPA